MVASSLYWKSLSGIFLNDLIRRQPHTAFCHRHLNTGRVIYFNTQNPICYRTYICNQLSKAERIPCWASRTAGYKYNRKWLIPSIPKEKRKLEHPSDKLPESVPVWISNLGFRPQSSCFLACSYYQGIHLFLFWKMFVICNVWKFSCLVKPCLTPPSYAVDQVIIIKPYLFILWFKFIIYFHSYS